VDQQQIANLQAERKFLQERLGSLPATARVTRLSTEARLRSIEAELATSPAAGRAPARARLTFRGRPVVGNHGVFAEFGMNATKAFADSVALIAASLGGPLSATGPIPNRDQNQLLITSTAVGSFGFELEEYLGEQLPLLEEETPLSRALEVAQGLLQSTQGTDDDLADSAAATDPRAIAAVRGFLETLASNEAICALEYRGKTFQFSDVGAVRRSLARLSQDNLREEEQVMEGEFRGALPKRRLFEFQPAGTDEILGGKVGPAIADVDVLNERLHRPARVKVVVTRVGNGRPRYVLIAPPQWLGDRT
jgi:hypothetical protein